MGHFFVLGLLLKTEGEGQKIIRTPDILTVMNGTAREIVICNIAKREQKPTYTNAMFQHVFVILCAHVCV